MNTVEKGDLLELKAYELLKELLENDDFYLPSKKSKIFWKKSYFSKESKGKIIFDITIETYMDGAEDYSLLTVIECKNLKRNVEISDVRDFSSKITEVGEHNTKGIIISGSLFQEGAYNYAVSKKISLVRIIGNDKLQWINYRKEKKDKIANHKELQSLFTNENSDSDKLIASINNKRINNFADVLIENKIIDFYTHSEKFINVPYISVDKITEYIRRLTKYGIHEGEMLDTSKLCNVLSKFYPISFDFETILPNDILGKIDFDPLKITVPMKSGGDLNRWRFTFAHEIGHLVLHYNLLKDKLTEKIETEDSIISQQHLSNENSKRLELQANIFASNLLLPSDALTRTVKVFLMEENIQKNYLYLDNQECNQQLVFKLQKKVSLDYKVSLKVAKLRLINLNFVKDTTRPSWKKLLGEKNPIED